MLKKAKLAKPPEKSSGKTNQREFRKFINLIRKGKATTPIIVILPQQDGRQLKVLSIDQKKRIVCGGYI